MYGDGSCIVVPDLSVKNSNRDSPKFNRPVFYERTHGQLLGVLDLWSKAKLTWASPEWPNCLLAEGVRGSNPSTWFLSAPRIVFFSKLLNRLMRFCCCLPASNPCHVQDFSLPSPNFYPPIVWRNCFSRRGGFSFREINVFLSNYNYTCSTFGKNKLEQRMLISFNPNRK